MACVWAKYAFPQVSQCSPTGQYRLNDEWIRSYSTMIRLLASKVHPSVPILTDPLAYLSCLSYFSLSHFGPYFGGLSL